MKVKKLKMSSADPLARVASGEIELKYSKLHSPKMKSVYWRHFGFPTNEDDRIITKQNVVCTLCFKVLTNHGNTTNLRAHLQHRHKDIFNKMITENNIKVPPRKPPPKTSQVKRENIDRRRIKIEFADDSLQDASNSASLTAEDQSMLYETLVPMTYEDDEIIDSDHFAKVEVSGCISQMKNLSNDQGSVMCSPMDSKMPINFRVDVIDEIGLQDLLVNLIIQDMLNVDDMYDPGMSNFIRMLSGSVTLPTEKKIMSMIRELHNDKLTMLGDQIKMHSQLKPFSLGFEIWTNAEQRNFLTIYINHTTDAPDYNLVNQLYATIEYNKFTSIDSVFEEFNMQNCTAAVVSYDCDDYLKHYLKEKNIPIILSYDIVADKCLRSVFSIPEVASIIDQVKDVIMRYSSEISSKDVEVPSCNDEFPWTYYELLKFFSETVSWPDDVDSLANSAKTVADTLSALVVTLDTLKGEEIPHSSMLAPITTKILNKKLSITDTDDELVANIKTAISTELRKCVIEEHHLTISALLDPRFHRLTNMEHITNCIDILKDKFNKLCEAGGYASSTLKPQIDKPNTSSNARKSNLELFFDLQETSVVDVPQDDSNIETDLKRYRHEVYVSLDESPFVWWNKMGHLYGSLKQMAQLYQCVPCVVNMNFKKPIKQQISEFQKRYLLSGTLIDAILFLHHNNK